jgi:TatD DNase family protein
MQLVDSHCHLPLIDGGSEGLAGILARASAAGVVHMLCVAVDLQTYAGVAAVASPVCTGLGFRRRSPQYRARYARAGHRGIDCTRRQRARRRGGETGLDYFRSAGDLEWQRARFRTHIRAAREVDKPLIVHCRDAAPDVLTLLREERAHEVGGVMHCFVDDWDTALAAIDLGFYISLSGIVTFKSARELQDVARRLPSARLLVETDSPWLAPVPRRGQQNEPAYVRHTAEFVAALRGEEVADFASNTTPNFFELFRLAA